MFSFFTCAICCCKLSFYSLSCQFSVNLLVHALFISHTVTCVKIPDTSKRKFFQFRIIHIKYSGGVMLGPPPPKKIHPWLHVFMSTITSSCRHVALRVIKVEESITDHTEHKLQLFCIGWSLVPHPNCSESSSASRWPWACSYKTQGPPG